ncbi:hypothetical protein FRC03_003170 [Tulasnella sp. 419]|nr:hypothetical protein FRC03_003170 [Tulasnella sp. 419]
MANSTPQFQTQPPGGESHYSPDYTTMGRVNQPRMDVLNPTGVPGLQELVNSSVAQPDQRKLMYAMLGIGDSMSPDQSKKSPQMLLNADAQVYDEGPSANKVLKSILIRLSLQFGDLLSLSVQAQDRFKQNRDAGDLKGAIHYLLQALHLPVPLHVLRAAAMGHMGELLVGSYKHCGSLQDLKESILYCRGAVLLWTPGHPGHSYLLNGVANCLRFSFRESGNIGDLDEAISCYTKAVSLHSPDDRAVDRSEISSNLAGCLRVRFQQTGDVSDLESAIGYLKEGLQRIPPGRPGRFTILYNLGSCLRASHEHNGSDSDMGEAISYLEEALSLCPPGHEQRSAILGNLAFCLLDQYERGGDAQDLEESIRYVSEAVDIKPAGCLDHSNALRLLGCCLHMRHLQLGEDKDLEDAILSHSNAVLLSSSGSMHRAESLQNLAACFLTRYHRQDNAKDLVKGFKYLVEALRLVPPGSFHYRSIVLEISRCSLTLHERQPTGDIPGKITEMLKQMIPHYPLNHTSRPSAMNILASTLENQYAKSGNIPYLEEAIQYHRGVMELSLPGETSRIFTRANLPRCLIARYAQQRQIQDLREAIDSLQQAIQDTPSGHPSLCDIQVQLASVYSEYFSTLKELGYALDSWEALLKAATNHSAASLKARLRAALKWIISVDHASSLPAYQKYLELADQYILVRRSITSRHQLLRSIPRHLVSDGAAAAINADDIKRAVELLEQGRTILWSQLNRYRTPLDSLERVNPQIAAEFMRLSQLLERSAVANPSTHLPELSMEQEASRYSQIARDWSDVVERTRQIEGCETFLQPPSYSTLQQSSRNGPVIVINASSFRCDVIIILKDADPILLPLIHTRLSDILVLAQNFDREIRAATIDGAQILGVLRALWDDIVQPVVVKLQELDIAPGSRIWWCPTSLLATLPLHAAGPHRRNKLNLCDIYISSYTPTLSALAKLNSDPPSLMDPSRHPPSLPHLLVVAQPDTPGQPQIPCVKEELEKLEKLVPLTEILLSEHGTCDNVLSKLQRHGWVHFMCHGSRSQEDPFKSCFWLYDKSLTLLDIVEARLPDAQFACLSACHSAAGDANTPDETIHLAAALQFTGFRSVIGTMYAMADIDGPTVAEEVYNHLFRRKEMGGSADYRDAAEALNIATKELKKRGVPVERWINFVHFGA